MLFCVQSLSNVGVLACTVMWIRVVCPCVIAVVVHRHTTVSATSAAKRESMDQMESYQEEILGPLTACKEKHDAVAAEAEAFATALNLNKERLQKLPLLDEVDAWLAARAELFAHAEYGSTLVEVATLLSSHAEVFTASLPSKKEALDSMESEQDVINERLSASRASMLDVEEAAAAYENELLLSQERLEKLPTLARIDEWITTTTALIEQEEYGSTLVEVATLLSSYDSLKVGMTAKQEVRRCVGRESLRFAKGDRRVMYC